MDRDGMEAHLLSTKIVEAVFDDLMGRKGLDAFFEELDGYVFKEIHDTLREDVKDVLARYG
jgi:hypothetical protein